MKKGKQQNLLLRKEDVSIIVIPMVKKAKNQKINIRIMKNRHIILLFIVCPFLLFGQAKKILFTNGYLHVGNGQVIETALLGVVDGKISLVKNVLTSTIKKQDWDTIIELNGQHIYPAFVAPNSTLGLTEIDAVRATRDFNDVGELNPHVRTQVAFNVESRVIETVRTNGVMLTQSTPRGGTISGSSAVMFLSGWNWEDATVLADDGIHVNWPSSTQGGGWWAEPAPKSRNTNYQKEKEEIMDFFTLAEVYAKGSKSIEDLRLEAMKPCFVGSKRVYFHADGMQQILDIIEFAEKYNSETPTEITLPNYGDEESQRDRNLKEMEAEQKEREEKGEMKIESKKTLKHLKKFNENFVRR